MKIYILALIITLSSFITQAKSIQCGNAQATVLSTQSHAFKYFGVAVFHEGYQKTYKFDVTKEYFKMRCETTPSGKKYFLILHSCGGSGCADLANFGIIDSDSGELLLKPDAPFKGNLEKALGILKVKPKRFSCKYHKSTKTELCTKSGIELG